MARLREIALQQRMPLIWLLDSAGARIQEAAGSLFAGSGHLFREEVQMSGVVPLVAAMIGPCAAGTAYIPGALGLRADGRRPGGDGARRPAPDEGRHRRGHLDGGARRGQGPLPQVRRRRPRGQGRRRVHRGGQGLPLVLPVELRAAAAACARPTTRPTGCRRSCSRSSPSRTAQPYDMYERDPRDRRRRRVLRHQAEVREDDHHQPGALRRPAGRDRRQPAEAARRHPRERLGRQGGALRQPLRRLLDPARLPPGRARLHGRLEGRARRDHPPRREDALRDLAGDGAEDHRRRPQGLRRRLLRDERRAPTSPTRSTPGRRPRSR